MQDPTLSRRSGREVFSGFLLKSGKGAIVKHPFRYEIVTSRQFSSAASAMPLSYASVVEVIRTSRTELPFALGDKVTLVGDRTLTVQAVGEIREPKLAALGLPNLTGYTITLEGGGK